MSESDVLKHPIIDCLQFLAKHDANPVGLHRELGIPYRQLYSILCQLDKLGLIGCKRFSRYNYHISEKGKDAFSDFVAIIAQGGLKDKRII